MSIEPIGLEDPKDTKAYVCKKCSTSFPRLELLGQHSKKEHPKKKPNDQETPKESQGGQGTLGTKKLDSEIRIQGETGSQELQASVKQLQADFKNIKELLESSRQHQGMPETFDGDKLDEALDSEVIERTDKTFGAPKKVVFSSDSLAIMSYINKKGGFKDITADDFVNRCIVEYAKNRGWHMVLMHVTDYEKGD